MQFSFVNIKISKSVTASHFSERVNKKKYQQKENENDELTSKQAMYWAGTKILPSC